MPASTRRFITVLSFQDVLLGYSQLDSTTLRTQVSWKRTVTVRPIPRGETRVPVAAHHVPQPESSLGRQPRDPVDKSDVARLQRRMISISNQPALIDFTS